MIQDHLEKLKHFVGVARAKSIRSYSIQNRLSQPAISKSIQILESVLETGLFVRDREGVQLTQSGQVLYEWADKILIEAQQIEESIRMQGNVRLKGRLTLGTYQSIAVYFIPRLFKFLARTQEHFRLDFVTASSSELVKLLKSGSVDFIISIDPPKEKGLFQTTLFKDTYSLYRSTKGNSQLGSAPIFTLLTAQDENGRTIESFLESAKIKSDVISCGDFEAAKAMLEADAGLAFLPEKVAKPLVDSKKAEKASTLKTLNAVGEHSIVFTSKLHRADDKSIQWISRQILLMLRDG